MKKDLKSLDFGLLGVSVYRGVIITKMIGGYMVLNTKCKSQEEVNTVIDKSLKDIGNSIIIE